ncbi:MAG: transglycosylase SLT domain-containing protein [Rikenellaceae bacterium]|nr:transglycosylase SLT domain-containing protein [Rikenellaceae bacterium]
MKFEKTVKFAILALAALLSAGAFIVPKKRIEEKQERYIPFAERHRQKHYKISPYDSLIRAWSDSASLDWRFVSAIVYHESHFRHDAVSRRGAIGLMQMMPSTAAHYGADSLLDASQNVMAGTRYIKDLYRSYGKVAADETERKKLTLAAYNAGGGRVEDLINYTRYRGKDPSYWDNIVSVIPEMRADSILTLDTVKLGKFNGKETIEFVEGVMARYHKFKRIAP